MTIRYFPDLIQGSDEWRIVADFPDYAVSARGTVKRVCPDPLGRIRGGERDGTVTGRGYRQITLWRDGKQYAVHVHKLVCTAFHGPAPSSRHEVAHGDGNRLNNKADNLRWAKHIENEQDKKHHGTVARGERQGSSKLSSNDIIAIRSDNRSQRAIAVNYGITQALVSLIKLRKAWEHVA